MKLKARPYLHYAPVSGGVYFAAARGQLVLRGSELLFRVADRVVPLLETGATEDELVAAVGDERSRKVVRHIVDHLRAKDLLLDYAAHTAAEPGEEERRAFGGPLAYLESLSDDPYAAFARLRTATVVVIGDGPAARAATRGLLRAGIGEVRDPDPADPYAGADAAVLVDGDPGAAPVSLPVVPVVLADRALLAGPALAGPAFTGAASWRAFRERALNRAETDGVAPAARPVADALAGALAAHLLVAELAGIAELGAAYVVHGAELTADRVVVTAPGHDERWHTLEDAPPTALPSRPETVDSLAELVAPWTGRAVRGSAEEELPQLPLSQRELVRRDGATGSVFAWAPDLESATVGVALALLRESVPGGAAGLSEQLWLLDGALRHLTGLARPVGPATVADMARETYRIHQIFTSAYAGEHVLRALAVPQVDWRLVRVETAGGELLGAAWGPDLDTAIRYAVGTALHAYQVRALRPDRLGAPPVRTDALVFAGDDVVDALRKQVLGGAAADGLRYRGRSLGDPVLGNLPVWYGPVEAVTR